MIRKTESKTMKKFEYKVIKTNVLSAIQEEGQQGWQVVSYDYKAVLLMREINEESGRA